MITLVSRVWQCFNSTEVPKTGDALRFGVLGAADVVPLVLTRPAISHPEVIVQAVAARDPERAEAFAKTNGITEVKNTYQVRTRTLALWNHLTGVLWHRVDVSDAYAIRAKDGKVVKQWTESQPSRKAYTFKEAGGELVKLSVEAHWISHRHQLEWLVNRVKGRGTQAWMDGQDSINQMKAIDMAHEKSGLGLRPSRGLEVAQ